MIATIAIASRDKNYFAVWLGATLGLMASNCLAIIAGKTLSKYLTGKVIALTTAAIYIIVGILALKQGLF
jgi:putative Ca2+/H+ antiporter (TMEM165/GDT1 family)